MKKCMNCNREIDSSGDSLRCGLCRDKFRNSLTTSSPTYVSVLRMISYPSNYLKAKDTGTSF